MYAADHDAYHPTFVRRNYYVLHLRIFRMQYDPATFRAIGLYRRFVTYERNYGLSVFRRVLLANHQ